MRYIQRSLAAVVVAAAAAADDDDDDDIVQMAPEERRPVTEDGEAASTQEIARPYEDEVNTVSQLSPCLHVRNSVWNAVKKTECII